jgi:hypothetical protein
VIVSRDGAFVTCLAAGMAVRDAWTVPRDRLADVDAELRAMRDASAEAESRGGARALLNRLHEQGPAISREEIRTIDAWIPLFESDLWWVLFDRWNLLREFEGGFRRGQYRGRLDAIARRQLRTYWNETWAVGHLTLLLARRFDWFAEWLERQAPAVAAKLSHFLWPAASSGIPGLVLRAAWASSRIAGRFFDAWIDAHRGVISAPEALFMSFGLAALALREPDRMDAVREALRLQLPAELHGLAPERRTSRWTEHTIHSLLAMLENPGALGVRAADGIKAMCGGLDDEAIRRAGVAPALLLGGNLYKIRGGGTVAWLLPAVVESDALELYLPADLLCHWPARLSDEKILEHLGEVQDVLGTHTPKRAQAKPGRNDPCACGSGKKFKRCCAA